MGRRACLRFRAIDYAPALIILAMPGNVVDHRSLYEFPILVAFAKRAEQSHEFLVRASSGSIDEPRLPRAAKRVLGKDISDGDS